jgi:heme A synthase
MRLHRFALLTVLSTFVLLIVGGLVHGTGSSLACPDWPLCHGQFFPPMKHGVEYEHSHRLAAGWVALLTVVLGVWIYRTPAHRSLRPLAVAAPIMVLVQAVLGGLTVIFKLPKAITLSHLTLSMCFFSVLIVLAIRTRPGHRGLDVEPPSVDASARARTARRLAGVSVAAVLGQIFLGGMVRHSMAGLACITFPLCFGHVWPPESSSVQSERIHMLHRMGGCVVALVVVIAAVLVHRASRSRTPDARLLRGLAIAAPITVAIQITLGVLSVTSLLHLPTVTAHLGVGAALLGVMVSMWALLPASSAAGEVELGALPAPNRGVTA